MGPALILSGAALLLSGAGFWLGRRLRPPSRIEAGVGSPPRTLSVVIPARNEEDNLPVLLASLTKQVPAPLEIVLVDDGSTDATAQRAQEGGARVIPSVPLPEGWRGKTWACHQGARAARGNWILFLDADTWFEPDGLAGFLQGFSGGAKSLGPWHAVKRWDEDLSLFFNIAMHVGILPDGLFGQSLLVDRETYERAGGHEAVKGRILENVHLADLFRGNGDRVRSESGRGRFSIRMYPEGFSSLVEGWGKAFAAGAGRTPGFSLTMMVAWMTGLMLSVLAVLFGPDQPVPWIVYGALVIQTGWLARKVGGFRFASITLFPVPLMFFFFLFGWSAFRQGKTVTWKGRTIRAG